MSPFRDENLGLAIGLSIGSGLCTSIGGLAVYVDVISKQTQSLILSSALALSAGVMLYVSFIEIFAKANDAIETAYEPGVALGITTVCFFAGMGITAILELIVHRITHHAGVPHSHGIMDPPAAICAGGARADKAPSELDVVVHAPGAGGGEPRRGASEALGEEDGAALEPAHDGEEQRIDKAQLRSTALMTALSIALHNFPEGLATFIATLAQPSLGIALAVAIAVHNVPEGMAVAFPVYYTSGSKLKGLLWATLSGLTEPLGGCIGARTPPPPPRLRFRAGAPPTQQAAGPVPCARPHARRAYALPLGPRAPAGWLILRNHLDDVGFGVVFAMVGGMMVRTRPASPTALAGPDEGLRAHAGYGLRRLTARGACVRVCAGLHRDPRDGAHRRQIRRQVRARRGAARAGKEVRSARGCNACAHSCTRLASPRPAAAKCARRATSCWACSSWRSASCSSPCDHSRLGTRQPRALLGARPATDIASLTLWSPVRPTYLLF